MSAARPFLVVLVGLVLVACGPPAKEDTTFHNTDVTGTWDVYRTYTGGPEQGPDAAAFTNVVSGFGVRAQFACSSHVLPSGHMAIAGELHGTALTLSSSDATYVGTEIGRAHV